MIEEIWKSESISAGRIRWSIWSQIEKGTAGVANPPAGNQPSRSEKI